MPTRFDCVRKRKRGLLPYKTFIRLNHFFVQCSSFSSRLACRNQPMLIENCKFASRDDCLGPTPVRWTACLGARAKVLCLFADASSNRMDTAFWLGKSSYCSCRFVKIRKKLPLDLWHDHARYPSSRMGGHRAACSASCPSTTPCRDRCQNFPNCHEHQVDRCCTPEEVSLPRHLDRAPPPCNPDLSAFEPALPDFESQHRHWTAVQKSHLPHQSTIHNPQSTIHHSQSLFLPTNRSSFNPSRFRPAASYNRHPRWGRFPLSPKRQIRDWLWLLPISALCPLSGISTRLVQDPDGVYRRESFPLHGPEAELFVIVVVHPLRPGESCELTLRRRIICRRGDTVLRLQKSGFRAGFNDSSPHSPVRPERLGF